MPITQMHLYAADRLREVAEIKDFKTFRIATVFPDCLWYKLFHVSDIVPDDVQDKISKLHFAKYMGSLRFPDFIGFCSQFSYLINTIDWYKGYLFHLILDYCNNHEWVKYTMTGDGENVRICVPESGVDIQCKSFAELLSLKYGDMAAFLDKKHYVPDLLECTTNALIHSTEDAGSVVLEGLVENCNLEILDKAEVGINKEAGLFPMGYYEDIVSNALKLYEYMIELSVGFDS